MKRLLCLLCLLVVAAQLRAHEGQQHKIFGTVSLVHENHLEVKGIDARTRSVTLTDKTKILRGTTPVKAADIRRAERIVVTATETKDATGKALLVASEVRLGAASVAPPPQPMKAPDRPAPTIGHQHPAAQKPAMPTEHQHRPAPKPTMRTEHQHPPTQQPAVPTEQPHPRAEKPPMPTEHQHPPTQKPAVSTEPPHPPAERAAMPADHRPPAAPTGTAGSEQPVQHRHAAMQGQPWHVMQDGIAFFTYNRQGGPRGGDELVSQNWWMAMAERPAAGGTLQMTLMLSVDPATVGSDGYREIFQVGETLDDAPLIDRQHPHDFLMQAGIVWKRPLPRDYRLTLAAAPVGEPALGPVAFMHRASAFENPTAPLGHHTFDSTHIAMGVLTAGIDRGPWHVESSVFRGREPDEQRWDLMDPGPLDSWSLRGWYRPNAAWTFQVSHGFLTKPEELEEGNVRRTAASASWLLGRDSDNWTATTIAYGRNDKHAADYSAILLEGTHVFGANSAYGRFEALQVETNLLRFGRHEPEEGHDHDITRVDIVKALTLGGVRRIGRWSNWDAGAGADVTFYGVPQILKATHSSGPVSFHVFVRIRPPAPMGRMLDMTMTRGMH